MKYLLIILLLTSCNGYQRLQRYNLTNIDDISWVYADKIILDSLDRHPESKYWRCEAREYGFIVKP